MIRKLLLSTLGLALCSVANAAVIDVEYTFDGASFTSVYGNELIGTELQVGDTLNLTYTAEGTNSYWDFSTIGSNEGNVNLGFEYPGSCGTRSSHGDFSVSLDNSVLLSDSYTVGGQSCIHLGPNYIDFSTVSMLDQFSISYTMDASSIGENIIGSYSDSTWWQIWELFDGSEASFNYEPDPVSEPAIIALFVLGLAGLGFARKRK